MRIISSLAIALVVCLILASCASVVPSVELSEREIETQLSIPNGKAVIYLLRKIEFKGSALLIPVSLNKVTKGALGHKTYFRWLVEPGKYTITSEMAEGAEIHIAVRDGKNYFIQIATTFGFPQPGSEFTLMSNEEGRKNIKRSRLVSSQNSPTLTPSSTFYVIAATVYSPNEAGWALSERSNNYGVIFTRQDGTSENSTIFNTIVFKTEGFDNDSDFLDYNEQQMKLKGDKSRFKYINSSYEQVSFKNTACLKYRTLVEDHWELGINSDYFLYYKTSGYVCRHPINKSIAFRMEASHRSKFKKFPEGFLISGESFFSSIQFNKNGL